MSAFADIQGPGCLGGNEYSNCKNAPEPVFYFSSVSNPNVGPTRVENRPNLPLFRCGYCRRNMSGLLSDLAGRGENSREQAESGYRSWRAGCYFASSISQVNRSVGSQPCGVKCERLPAKVCETPAARTHRACGKTRRRRVCFGRQAVKNPSTGLPNSASQGESYHPRNSHRSEFHPEDV
jgi:hypothetical protein